MKKLVSLLLALSLLLTAGAALAENVPQEENAAPTREEIEMYLDSFRDAALAESEAMNIYQNETLGIIAETPEVSLIIADEELRATTAILGVIILNEDQPCPRGIMIGDSLEDVLSIYPNDNPTLLGSYYDAALFLAGEKPEVSVGYVLRDGQRVTDVIYGVYSWTADGVVISSICYTLDQGVVTEMDVTSGIITITEEEALADIDDMIAMQEVTEYFAYPQSADGTTLAPFEREDLNFSGLDILSLTMEQAIQVLGDPYVDDWMTDSTGEYLRTRQWEDVSIVFVYDVNRQFLRVDSMTISGESVDGPRGVRVGDMMETVINRFNHGFGSLEAGIALYGDGTTAPYGVISYGEETTAITYACALDDAQVVYWHLTFVEGELQEMRFLLR